MTKHTFIAAVALALLACPLHAAEAAPKPKRIEAARCPPKTSCVSAEIVVIDFDKRSVDVTPMVDESRREPHDCGTRSVAVRGRMNGGRVAVYSLDLPQSCLPCGNGTVTHMGWSRAGHPLLATTAGRFEIIDKRVFIGAPDQLALIDAKTGKVAKYWGNSSDTKFYYEGNRIYFDDGECFMAPQTPIGRFTLAPGKCNKSVSDQYEPEKISPAAQKALEDLGAGSPSALPGTDLLAAQFGDGCS